MTESVKDIIERLRAKQLGWWKHLKSEGWHLCAICKKRPIAIEATICAFCLDAKRRGRLPKPHGYESTPVKKEKPDDQR